MTLASISCLCGRTKTDVQLLGKLPVQSVACHQSSCRHNLGALYHSLLSIQELPVTEGLSVYAANETVRRFFCNVCGSHIYQQSDQFYIQSGVVTGIHLEQVSGALEKIAEHRYVEQTLDGGIVRCFRDFTLTPFVKTPQQRPVVSQAALDLAGVGSADGALTASCACGGVEFFLTRPRAESVICSSPWPDLVFPYHSHSGRNPQDRKWWVNDDKWLAGLCACKSCRLGLSVPLQAWAFVAKTNIFQLTGQPLTYDMGKLQSFESSPGARREFCGVCGATVFWHNIERPGVVDVSVGLLQAEEGALARSWLSWWTSRVSFAEHALDKELIEGIQDKLNLLA